MSRGGMVYVKRDLSHEEAPRTFEKEQGSPLLPWLKWAEQVFASHSDADPPELTPPKGINEKIKGAARRAFLDVLSKSGPQPVQVCDRVIRGVAPALGWPWEGVEGSRFMAKPEESWLLAGEDVSAKSAWVDWATAAVHLMKEPTVANTFLPKATVVEPWNAKDNQGQWCYRVLEAWWKCANSFAPPVHLKEMASRWEGLASAIDDRLHHNPSPLGLPLHWQVSVRQLEKCLLHRPACPLDAMDPLPPVHTEIRMGALATKSRWMGVAEWALLRFGNMVHATKSWPPGEWEHFRAVIEQDVATRMEGAASLLAPFREHLLSGVEKFTYKDANGRLSRDDRRIAQCRAEIVAWWLGDLLTAKPASPAPSRSMCL